MLSKPKIYAIYKGENLLCMGTAQECAKTMSVTVDYIKWLTTTTEKRRLASRKYPEKCVVGLLVEE